VLGEVCILDTESSNPYLILDRSMSLVIYFVDRASCSDSW